MASRQSSAHELLVSTALGYEFLAAAVVLPPLGVLALAPLTWLPAALPLVFRGNRRSFRIAASVAGAWLVFLSAWSAILGGLIFLPGAVALLLAAWVSPGRTWPIRRYWAIAATPVAVVAVVVAASYVMERLGPETGFEVRLVPEATETQKDEFVEVFFRDEAVAATGGQGPFDAGDPVFFYPEYPMESRESQDLERRLRAHPLVKSVRPCRC